MMKVHTRHIIIAIIIAVILLIIGRVSARWSASASPGVGSAGHAGVHNPTGAMNRQSPALVAYHHAEQAA
jgi:DNA-binding transcriptional regulator of glucitol operon